MFRTAIHVATAAVALSAVLALAPTASTSVVINEVLYDPEGPDTGHEFVELVNCGSQGVLLTGWVLQTGNGANPDDWTNEWIGGDLDYLEPGGILLIGESDVVPEPDYVTPLDLQNGPDAVRLTDGADPVDVVGWGEPLFAEYYEGRPAADVESGRSLSRLPDCFDHDDNALDLATSPPTPGLQNSATFDLALSVRHAGRRVFGLDETLGLVCIATNVGARPTGGEPITFELSLRDGDTVATATVMDDLAPRDSLEVTLLWPLPSSGYHRARVELSFAPDRDVSNNSGATSLTVGGVGWLVAINEIMHSPDDLGTEWVELTAVGGESVDVRGWALGDDLEAGTLGQDSTAVLAPGCFLLLAKDAEVFDENTSCQVLETDDWEALSADDTVVLLDEFGTIMERVVYDRHWGGERGVSLERVRPDMSPDEPGNWGSSVAPGGSTPGRTNSIYLGATPSAGTLSAAPNPFTPNGDGEDDRTVISVELPVARATARVTVFDLEGRVRALLADHVAVSSSSDLLWDGTGTDGEPLPSGLYLVCLEAINERAGVFVTAKTAVGIVR
jgi:hypothetical protein